MKLFLIFQYFSDLYIMKLEYTYPNFVNNTSGKGLLRMVTIRFIAKEAGVSKSTVSRYLNNGQVSDDTAAKIEETIKKYNYKPNDFARNLKSNHSDFIGVIIPRFDSAATIDILEGIDDFDFGKEYQKLIVNAKQDSKKEIEAMYDFEKNKVAGIILLATEITTDHIEAIQKIDIPTIIVGQYDEKLYCVTHDDYQAAQDLTKHLLKHQPKKIIYIGVSERDVSVGQERKSGVIDAVKSLKSVPFKFIESTFSGEEAYELGKKVLLHENDTFVICATDNIAIGMMKAARELGKKIPEEISLAGFGGYGIGEQVYPTLTTVDYHFYQTGTAAAKSLEKLINGQQLAHKVVIETSVLEKDSIKKTEKA